jgi:hypothetical protein
MITPTIHLNGTSGAVLLEQQLKARAALRAAIDAMVDAYPNGRDYYPQRAGAGAQAQREHEARVAAVAAVADQYEAIAEAISTQIDARAR